MKSSVTSKSLQHGLAFEKTAIKKFEEMNVVTTHPCGIFVSCSKPFLSATPDAVIGENCVLEVKCPYVSRDEMINTKTVPYLKCVNEELTLDESHDYFYQVQGQLFCTQREICKFTVFTFKDIKTITIKRDENFITTMIEKLTDFYENYFRKELLKQNYYKGSANFAEY